MVQEEKYLINKIFIYSEGIDLDGLLTIPINLFSKVKENLEDLKENDSERYLGKISKVEDDYHFVGGSYFIEGCEIQIGTAMRGASESFEMIKLISENSSSATNLEKKVGLRT